jgi:bacterioferritin-associated ferredoxin
VYICLCKGISESEVRALGRSGICSAEQLALTLGLDEDGICGRCLRNIEALVALATRDLAGTSSTVLTQSTLSGLAITTSWNVQRPSH